MRALTLFITLIFNFCLAAGVEGNWRTIDDETGEARSVLSLWVDNGELKGKVVSLINPDEPNPVCEKCQGKRKNQPIEGMTIIWGLKQMDNQWSGGTILDPSNGKEYKAKLALGEGGNTLEVRGFIGFALIGRTQIWQRAD